MTLFKTAALSLSPHFPNFESGISLGWKQSKETLDDDNTPYRLYKPVLVCFLEWVGDGTSSFSTFLQNHKGMLGKVVNGSDLRLTGLDAFKAACRMTNDRCQAALQAFERTEPFQPDVLHLNAAFASVYHLEDSSAIEYLRVLKAWKFDFTAESEGSMNSLLGYAASLGKIHCVQFLVEQFMDEVVKNPETPFWDHLLKPDGEYGANFLQHLAYALKDPVALLGLLQDLQFRYRADPQEAIVFSDVVSSLCENKNINQHTVLELVVGEGSPPSRWLEALKEFICELKTPLPVSSSDGGSSGIPKIPTTRRTPKTPKTPETPKTSKKERVPLGEGRSSSVKRGNGGDEGLHTLHRSSGMLNSAGNKSRPFDGHQFPGDFMSQDSGTSLLTASSNPVLGDHFLLDPLLHLTPGSPATVFSLTCVRSDDPRLTSDVTVLRGTGSEEGRLYIVGFPKPRPLAPEE